MNQPGLRSCTPLGVVELLKFNNTAIEGRDAVVIAHVAARADILIAAMGRAAFVGPEFVKEGATVIDVGINSVSDRALVEKLFGRDPKREMDLEQKGYTLVGDVDPRVIEKAAFLTPVPGGVGLLTVAMLMRNTLEAFRRRRSLG
jgi:methylenetetrahydrofolate dehydrogenase (NADP+)/methenyltetrahydrofolate cyclohydrolase